MANYTIDKFTFNGNTYVLEDSGAQRTLVSGTNIKTINNESILGSGNITVSGGTDEKLSVTQQDDTESSNIYPVLSTNSSTASKKKYSNLLAWKKGELTLGGTGSDSSKYAGGLNLYNSNGNHITLKYLTTATSNRTIYLPDKAGTDVTLACTADLDGKVSGNGEIIYGTCSTAAATRKKEVFCSYYNGLHTGMIAVVDFSYINTDAYPQLNLYTTGNGGGTKYIKENIGGTISDLTNPSSLNGTCIFVYNGTYWVLQHTDSVSGGGGGGTITGIKTTAGAHTAIDVSSGAANFNVPTKTSHLTNDSGFTTNTGTITGVTAGTGLSGGGTSGSVTLNHTNSVTEGTASSTTIGTEGSSVNIPYVTYDSTGHIKSWGERTHFVSGFSTATNMVNNGTTGVIGAGSITGASFIVTGHDDAIGYKTSRQQGTYSLASGTSFVTVPTSALDRITLTQGTWIIHAHAAFESNNTGRRSMRIYSVTTSEGLTRSFVNQTATNGASTNMNTMVIADVGSTSITYTIQLAQNSGSKNSVDLILEAVRIA